MHLARGSFHMISGRVTPAIEASRHLCKAHYSGGRGVLSRKVLGVCVQNGPVQKVRLAVVRTQARLDGRFSWAVLVGFGVNAATRR